jgi:hypothetical protein
MKELLHNKKAVSEMVGYVLLVIIAVSISSIVFVYLRYYVPNDSVPNCPNDINLIVEKVTCEITSSGSPQINLTLVNKGLFSVNAFYLRVGNSTKPKVSINDPIKIKAASGFYFNISDVNKGLLPGESFNHLYTEQPYGLSFLAKDGIYEISIEPAAYVTSSKGKKSLALCKDSIITQKISCN